MDKDEALRLALEALENLGNHDHVCPQWPTYAEPENYPKCNCGYDQAITAVKAALETKDEPIKLRRGDILRCIETDELCTVWATSTSGKTLVKWKANDFCNYTAEQIGELFWLEPKSSEIETQQTPVAWMTFNDLGEEDDIHYENPEAHLLEGWTYKPLYTTPPQRKPCGLECDCTDVCEQETDYKALWQQMCERCDELDKKLAQQEHGWTPERIAGMARLKAQQDKRLEPQRTWVGLTDEDEIDWEEGGNLKDLVKAIEAKLKEKNT